MHRFFHKTFYTPNEDERFLNRAYRINEGMRVGCTMALALLDDSPTAFLSSVPFRLRLLLTLLAELTVCIISGTRMTEEVLNVVNLKSNQTGTKNQGNRNMLLISMTLSAFGTALALAFNAFLDKTFGMTENKNVLSSLLFALYALTRISNLREARGRSREMMARHDLTHHSSASIAEKYRREIIYYNDQIFSVGITVIGSLAMVRQNNTDRAGFVMLVVNYFHQNYGSALQVLEQLGECHKNSDYQWQDIYAVENTPAQGIGRG